MSYSTTSPLQGNTGRIIQTVVSSLATGGRADVAWSEIAEPGFRLPIGASFDLIEELVIRVSVDDEKLVDVDMRYYEPHQFLGSWQLIGEFVSQLYPSAGEEGFLWYSDTTIVRKNRFTLIPTPGSKYLDGNSNIDNCNFRLAGTQLIFANASVISLSTGSDSSQFRAQNDRNMYALQGTVKTEIDTVGLYLNRGVSGISLLYDARIDNVAYANTNPPTSRLCGDTGNKCMDDFYMFLAGLTPTPPPEFAVALTLADATAIANAQLLAGAVTAVPELRQFPCPGGVPIPYYVVVTSGIIA